MYAFAAAGHATLQKAGRAVKPVAASVIRSARSNFYGVQFLG
jgi:hypothetical protein